MNRRPETESSTAVVAGYLVTLALLFVASFWRGGRVWGLSAWGYFDLATRLVLLTGGLAILAAVAYALRASHPGVESKHEGRGLWLWYLGIPFASGLVFYLLRAETHFLGDGYQQLANLAADDPLVRAGSFGAMTLNVWVKQVFGTGEAAALAAYRTISIGSGVLFTLATLYTARRLFRAVSARALFIGGMLSGGYVLLFFGYVENYALFCLSVGLFTYTGLLITHGHLKRAWLLPALAMAVFSHVLGVALLPAALYILLRDSRPAARFLRLGVAVRGAILIVIVVKVILLFAYLYSTSYHFRFAFVPLFPGRLVLEGYTLLSVRHLADWASLVLCLSPSLLLLVLFATRAGGRAIWLGPAVRFLLLAAAGALAATFIVDPKLGMPRNWDVFAYAGVPMVALLYYLTVRASTGPRGGRNAAILGIVLGLSTLLPRAVVQHTPRLAVAQMQDYAHLDVRRNRTAIHTLGRYLLDEGYVSEYRELNDYRDSVYMEDRLSQSAADAIRKQQYPQARSLASQLIAVNPQLFSGWTYLGKMYIAARRYDSALVALRIADGLNPGNPEILNELGLAYYKVRQQDKAEDIWLESAAIDTSQFSPHFALARIYVERGDSGSYLYRLRLAASQADAPASVSLELANYYLRGGEFEPAKAAIDRALALGADSASVRALRNKYPDLVDWKMFSAPADSAGP